MNSVSSNFCMLCFPEIIGKSVCMCMSHGRSNTEHYQGFINFIIDWFMSTGGMHVLRR